MRLRLLAFSLILALSLTAVPAHAAENGESITASPAQVRYSIDPGGKLNGSVKILNQGTVGYDFGVDSEDFSIQNEDYDKSFKLPENALDAGRWFNFPRTTFHLEPGQSVVVPFTVVVPPTASPGGHYAVLFAQTKPSTAPEVTGVITKKRVGSLFYITVNGPLQQEGSIASWQSNFWQISAPLASTLRMQNSGNVHFDSHAQVTVTDILGNKKAAIDTTLIVLPETIRRIELNWDKAPKFGLFKVSGQVEYLGKNEALKPHYVLMLSLQYFFVMFGLIVILIALAVFNRRKQHGRR